MVDTAEKSTTEEETNKKVKIHPTSLAALQALRKNEKSLQLLWENVSDESNDEQCQISTNWNSVQFDDDGHMTVLDLGGKRLKLALPSEFTALEKLTTINLGSTSLPPNALIQSLMLFVNTIEHLFLGGNSINDDITAKIAEILPSMKGLTKLDLRYNNIGAKGAEALASVLNSTGITVLHLEGNRIGNDNGANALAQTLKRNSTIVELYLGDNAVGPEGATAIAQVLQTNTTLQKIYLEGNRIGAKGAAAFTKELENNSYNTSLTKLYVDNNGIGKEEMDKLGKSLKSDTMVGSAF